MEKLNTEKLNNNMPNLQNLQNPFEQEENLATWLNKDSFYLQSKFTNLKQFKSTLNTPQQNNSIMPSQNPYTKLMHFITKNAILATLIMLVAVGTLGVAAAQAFAPENLKPSNILGITKISSTPSNDNSDTKKVEETKNEVVEEAKTEPIADKTKTEEKTSNEALSKLEATPSTANLKTYTNQFFPDFKLVYPEDWKFETTTKPMNDKLLIRTFKLSKNGFDLSFIISPNGPFGREPIFLPDPQTCDMPEMGSNELAVKNGVLTQTTLSNNINKFYVKTSCEGWKDVNDRVYYGELNVSSFQLKSNIKGKDVGYEFVDPQSGYILYNVSQAGGFKLSESKGLINEIDQIIAQSTFK